MSHFKNDFEQNDISLYFSPPNHHNQVLLGIHGDELHRWFHAFSFTRDNEGKIVGEGNEVHFRADDVFGLFAKLAEGQLRDEFQALLDKAAE